MLSLIALCIYLYVCIYLPGWEHFELWVLFPGNSSFQPNALHLSRECSCGVMAIRLRQTFSVRDVATSYWVRGLQTSSFSSKNWCVRHMGSHMWPRSDPSSFSVSAGIDRYIKICIKTTVTVTWIVQLLQTGNSSLRYGFDVREHPLQRTYYFGLCAMAQLLPDIKTQSHWKKTLKMLCDFTWNFFFCFLCRSLWIWP